MNRMTMAMVAMAAMPTILSAQQPQQDTSRTQQDTSRMQVDSARTNMQQSDSAARHADVHDTAVVRTGRTVPPSPQDTITMPQRVGFDQDSAAGAQQGEQGQRMGQASGRNARGSLGLTRSQVVQLQQALNNAGCEVGTADGVVGAKTRQAMQCARQQLGVTSNDNQALFQALNLDFASQESQADTTGAASTRSQSMRSQSSDPATQAVQGDSSQVGGRNMGRVRPPEDTTARVGGDTSATNRARQQGMTDSTMMRPDSMHHTPMDSTMMRPDSMHSPMDSTMRHPTSPTMRDTTRRVPPQR
jgi:peptidoglycan hydrolase-like protein with peptidoglycan-binding domain